MEPATGRGTALRERRREAGLTQLELAQRAGVSRQLIAAAEAGHNAPAVDAALRLAQALGTTVEALFSPVSPDVVPALGDRLGDGRPLRVGRVGDRLVAAELADHGTAGPAWAKPDAILESGRLRLFGGASPAGLVLAGCDPAIGVAEAMLAGRGARSLLALPAATGTALRALREGGVHAAVVHGPAGELPPAPTSVLRLHLARWQVGVAHAPGLQLSGLESLLEAGLPIVQRDPAAGSQQAFMRAVAKIGMPRESTGPRAAGHLDAARTAAILGCAAVTTESAARAFGLRFLPLEDHTVEIWVAEQWAADTAVDALANLLTSTAFTDRVSQFGGYELAGCGRRI